MNDSKPRKFTAKTPEQFAGRFWSKVNKDGPVPAHCPELGPCWEWLAYRNPAGYGEVGRREPRRVELCHRVSWELANGAAGASCVLHRCDNPACVNPGHLFLGTRTDNAIDKVAKGRQARGEGFSSASLTPEIVREIRALMSRGLGSCRIAKQLGIVRSSTEAVVCGRTWRHIK